jgi:hypothetical protein
MATTIRPELSEKNRYWISKHRHYELKHFCLQYPVWKQLYADCLDLSIRATKINETPSVGLSADLTAKYALRRTYYADRIKMVEKAALEADRDLYAYILKAVTEGLSFTYLKTRLDIPCTRDMYYDRYRRFFWLLSEMRY